MKVLKTFLSKHQKRELMSKYHVDRSVEYMYKMWGTTRLITDYWIKPKKTNDPEELDPQKQNPEQGI